MPLKITMNDREVGFSSKWFAGGESAFKLDGASLIPTGRCARIRADLYSSDDVMELIMACDALNELRSSVELIVPYLPYARQDRVCSPGEVFSLKVMARLLKDIPNVWRLVTWDVHNEAKTKELFTTGRVGTRTFSYENIGAETFVRNVYEGGKPKHPVMVVAPDKGALDRANRCAEEIGAVGVMHATKVRDAVTGAPKTTIPNLDFKDLDLLIVDDICDGGRTFIGLAQELRKVTKGRIDLYVTHGIFSYGNAVFRGVIDEIYTANLFPRKSPSSFFSTDAPKVYTTQL
jgi:ribose-phosphate pyrophosphokinase